MDFVVIEENPTDMKPGTYYLCKDSWNDYGYCTGYNLSYCDLQQNQISVGFVKIGEYKLSTEQCSPNLPKQFSKLDSDKFFSLGQENSYYQNIHELEHNAGYEILLALNDFVLCKDVYEKAKTERVTDLSLFRYTSFCKDRDKKIQTYFELLRPPLNLNTMKRIFGSTGWTDVDRGLLEMQRLLFNANIHLYYNAIATIGREILKGVAEKLYDDDLHRDKKQYPKVPTEDQFINKLHGIIGYLGAEKEVNEKLKNYIKSTIELVQAYVHKQNAEGFESFMCVHAVTALVFQLSILNRKDVYNEIALKN